MPSFNYETSAKLTEKQKQALQTVKNIVLAFYDDDKKKQRTWTKLRELTRLSSGALSKHLRELVKQGVVKGEVKINDKNNMQVFYEYTEEFFVVEGKEDSTLIPAGRVYSDKKRIIGVQWGYMKKGKSGRRYFVKQQ